MSNDIHVYSISTDGGSYDDFEAADVSEALEMTDCPTSVRSAEGFERWLNRCGGYGWIEEDGVRIAEVSHSIRG